MASTKEIWAFIEKWKLDSLRKNDQKVFNGTLLCAYRKGGGKSVTNAAKLIQERLGIQLHANLFLSHMKNRLIPQQKKMLNKPENKGNWDHFRLLCEMQWEVALKDSSPKKKKQSASAPALPSTPTLNPPRPAPALPSTPTLNPSVPAPLTPSTPSLKRIAPGICRGLIVPKKLRYDCGKCPELLDRIKQLEAEVRSLKSENEELVKARNEKEYDRKLARQALDRRTVSKDKFKRERDIFDKRLKRRENMLPLELARQLKNERIRTTVKSKQIEKVESELVEISKVCRKVEELQEKERCIENLECQLQEAEECQSYGDLEVMRGGQYGLKMRKIIYKFLKAKVPYSESEELMKHMLQACGVVVSHLPSESTLSRCIHELSVISILQSADALLESESSTICWDATSIGPLHINEVHVQTPQKNYTLSMSVLPGGQSSDYISHITSVIDKIVNVASKFKNVDREQMKATVLGKIKSTLTDRARVNTAVVRELRVLWNTDIAELHCNLHPLDGFANEVRSALKAMDSNAGLRKTGWDCCVVNFLYGLSKMK